MTPRRLSRRLLKKLIRRRRLLLRKKTHLMPLLLLSKRPLPRLKRKLLSPEPSPTLLSLSFLAERKISIESKNKNEKIENRDFCGHMPV
jgi:hypothetical protein